MPVFCIGVANVLNGAANADAASHRKHRLHFRAPNAKVLIVDDISTNLRVSKELMAFYSMEIHTSLSGPEAIELARANYYDIIFMDHMMPGMNGLEAAAAIRAISKNDRYYQNVPIIALTANALSGQREMFLQSGMNDFLAKPIELQKLHLILERWLPKEKQFYVEELDEVESQAEERPEFFEIHGVSIEAGLGNTGGSLAAYTDILADFCRDADERMEQVRRYAESGDCHRYMTLVHALKGAARNIGALEFADFAAQMEETARNEDAIAIRRNTDALLAILADILQGIRQALEQNMADADAQGGADLTQPQLKKLRSALTSMDITTVNQLIVEYSAAPLAARAKMDLSEIEHHILMFEYEKAIDRIDLMTQTA
jgi:CheY-like chemotaxis protein